MAVEFTEEVAESITEETIQSMIKSRSITIDKISDFPNIGTFKWTEKIFDETIARKFISNFSFLSYDGIEVDYPNLCIIESLIITLVTNVYGCNIILLSDWDIDLQITCTQLFSNNKLKQIKKKIRKFFENKFSFFIVNKIFMIKGKCQ